MIEPGARIISDVPYFMVPNILFDIKIMVTAYGQVKGQGKQQVCQRRIKLHEKMVYLYLCRCANGNNGAFPSYDTIVENCEICRSAAIKAVHTLCRSGLLLKMRRPETSNLYRVISPQFIQTVKDDHTTSSSVLSTPSISSSVLSTPEGFTQYTLKRRTYKDKIQQQPISDYRSEVDRDDDEKNAAVVVSNQPEMLVEKSHGHVTDNGLEKRP